MAYIRINPTADADAVSLFGHVFDEKKAAPQRARTHAGEVLKQELTRYCAGQLRGRSFLIAGHRGSGKTSMVNAVLHEVAQEQSALTSPPLPMRPLPVYIQAPRIFGMEEDGEGRAPTAGIGDAVDSVHYDQSLGMLVRQSTTRVEARRDGVARRMLTLSVLALHQAVAHEFSTRLQRIARSSTARRPKMRRGQRVELAAQFETEFMESPPASRLREFYKRLDSLEDGVLFDPPRRDQADVADERVGQGMRELVALVGVTHAHQRVSGEMRHSDDQKSGRTLDRETTAGAGFDIGKLLKPAMPVLAGAAVGSAAAVGAESLGMPIVLGVLAALGASLFLKFTTVTTTRHERKVAKTFLPDLSVATLDRMLPMVLHRLNKAGLAPIFIIDELDKVPDLMARMEPLVNNLKKLFAESVATCLLVDRSFFEDLRALERAEHYNLFYSYFSHRLLVTLLPYDLHEHLIALLEVENDYAKPEVVDVKLDVDVLRWILLHRSRLNGLSLNRLVEDFRRQTDRILPGEGAVRSKRHYRRDVTLQVAIQAEMADPKVIDWMEQHPQLLPSLFDTFFYLSRIRTDDARVDLGPAGRSKFVRYLVARMQSR